MTNLTLTIDEHLLRKARILALGQGTSVNAMVRDYLARAVDASGDASAKSAKLDALIARGTVNSAGQRLSREEMYDSEPRMQRLYRIVDRDQQPKPPVLHDSGAFE